MKTILSFAVTLAFCSHAALGRNENGIPVEASKSTTSNDDSDRRGYLDEVDLTLRLKVHAKISQLASSGLIYSQSQRPGATSSVPNPGEVPQLSPFHHAPETAPPVRNVRSFHRSDSLT